jgi:hypothetical protein
MAERYSAEASPDFRSLRMFHGCTIALPTPEFSRSGGLIVYSFLVVSSAGRFRTCGLHLSTVVAQFKGWPSGFFGARFP